MTYRPGRCLLRKRLRERDMSQQILVEITGIDKFRISDYANSKVIMNLATAKTIAAVLKCTIDDLYEWQIVSGEDDE